MLRKYFLLFFVLILSMGLNAQKSYVFIGSYNANKNTPGIYIYELDTSSGQLKEVSVVKDVQNSSFLTLSPDGKFVFACTSSQTPNTGSVSGFAFNSTTKNLTFINSQSSGGENPVFVSASSSGKWIINANYTGGSASVFRVNNEGEISPAAQVINYTDSSINKARQAKSHIHSAVFSPDNEYAFFPDLGADKIRIFKFEASLDKPLQKGPSSFAKVFPGSGPRHITFNSKSTIAYCIEEMGGAVDVYRFEKGILKPIQRLMMHSKNSDNHSPEDTPSYSGADIHLSPDGRFLYASNREPQNNIVIFSVKKDGKLKMISSDSTYGVHPRNFAIDPTGKFLIVANQRSGNLVVFKRNLSNGMLTRTGEEVKIESPSCIKIRQY
ncbi:MAG: lactonase family protein [Ginsengibacter sp.]